MNKETLAALNRIEVPPGIVLGLGQNGLATIRALGRKGIPVIGIDSNLDQPTAKSRYCIRVQCDDFKAGGEGLLHCLLDIGKNLPCKGVLFPSGDLNLIVVSEGREALEPYFLFALPEKESVRLILNKNDFYKFALREGFPIAKTYFLKGLEEIQEAARQISYPALIKPFLRDAAWREQHNLKLYEARSAEELIRECEHIFPMHHEILIQECIPGADSELSFSLTYLDRHLEPLAMFTGRKLRQEPPRFGTSSMAQSKWDPWIAETSISLLKALRYRGYGSVEFKRDPRDGAFKIIEVTGRTWYPHGLSTRCGVNLPYLAYCDLLGLKVERPQSFEEGVKWIDEDRDLRSSLQYHREGNLSLLAWIKSYRGKRTYALAAMDDPAPILSTIGRFGRGLLRRLGSLFVRHSGSVQWSKKGAGPQRPNAVKSGPSGLSGIQ